MQVSVLLGEHELMYLVSFLREGGKSRKVGVLLGESPSVGAPLPGEKAEGLVLDVGEFAHSVGSEIPQGMRAVLAKDNLEGLKGLYDRFLESWKRDRHSVQSCLVPVSDIRFLPPVADPLKIILTGKNYRGHCEEGDAELPREPVIFSKFRSSLIGQGDSIVIPAASSKVDFEAELAVVLSGGGRHISQEDALSHVAGYMALNDVSARDFQFSDGQWIRAKSCDTFCPCGPAIVTRDHVRNPQDLKVRLFLNGQLMQDGNTSQMMFPVARLISFISRVITLEPGDILATGTPEGVGCFRDPPVFLKAGDKVEVEIENVGRLSNPVTGEE